MDKFSLEGYKKEEQAREEAILEQKMTNINNMLESRKKRIESLSLIKSNLENIHRKLTEI